MCLARAEILGYMFYMSLFDFQGPNCSLQIVHANYEFCVPKDMQFKCQSYMSV